MLPIIAPFYLSVSHQCPTHARVHALAFGQQLKPIRCVLLLRQCVGCAVYLGRNVFLHCHRFPFVRSAPLFRHCSQLPYFALFNSGSPFQDDAINHARISAARPVANMAQNHSAGVLTWVVVNAWILVPPVSLRSQFAFLLPCLPSRYIISRHYRLSGFPVIHFSRL